MRRIQRLESGTKYSGRMVCEHLAYVELRRCPMMMPATRFGVRHHPATLFSREALDE